MAKKKAAAKTKKVVKRASKKATKKAAVDNDVEVAFTTLDEAEKRLKERMEKAKAADAVEARIADRYFKYVHEEYVKTGDRHDLEESVIALALTRNYRELMPNRQLVIEALSEELDKAIAEEEAERNPPAEEPAMETVPSETEGEEK